MLIVLLVFAFAVLLGTALAISKGDQLRDYGVTKKIKAEARVAEPDLDSPEPEEYS